MEETTIHRLRLHEAHRAAIAVRHDRLRAFRRFRERTKTGRDLVKRLIPTDRHKTSFALRARAPQTGLDALRAVRALVIVGDFGAERPARKRMTGIARDPHRAPAFDRYEHRASVRAIVWARAMHNLLFNRFVH